MVTFVIYFTAWYAPQATLSLHETDISTRACAMMNSWYSAQMHEMLPALSTGFLTRTPDNRISINNTQLVNTTRTSVFKKGLLPDDPATLARVCQITAKQAPQPSFPYRKPTFGYISLWLSEVGAPSGLAAILHHTDNHQPGSTAASTTRAATSGPTTTLTGSGRSWTPFSATPRS